MNLKRLFGFGGGGQRMSQTLGLSAGGPTGACVRARRWTVAAIDRSPSMDEQDWAPSRLEAAKVSALEYLDASAFDDPGNLVAFIAYDEYASVVCPFTPCVRRDIFEERLRSIRSGSYTNIAGALSLADRLLTPMARTPGELLVHLLTDGHHNCQGDPRAAAARLKASGIVIDVVGIGGSATAVDEALLLEIASEHPDGGKRYRFIGDARRLTQHYRLLAGRLTL